MAAGLRKEALLLVHSPLKTNSKIKKKGKKEKRGKTSGGGNEKGSFASRAQSTADTREHENKEKESERSGDECKRRAQKMQLVLRVLRETNMAAVLRMEAFLRVLGMLQTIRLAEVVLIHKYFA